MGRFEDEIRNEQIKQQTGSYARFTDIKGIGPATAKKIKNADYNIQAPKDVADMSTDELADKAGISRDRATKAIKGGGGNPNVSKRSNTGSVSAAGIKQRTGDFWVGFAAQDKARARNDPRSRSEEAVRQDEKRRAPVTTDLEQWKENPGRWDFPGVDTPTQEPKALPKDYKAGGEFTTTDVDTDTEVATGSDRSGFAAYPEAAAGGSMEDAFMAEMVGRDVPASPGEVRDGAMVDSMINNNIGGPIYQAGVGPRETDRSDRMQKPPERALRKQKNDKGIQGGDSDGDEIAFIYRNSDVDLELDEFRRRTKRVGRKMGLNDAFGNAQMVANDPEINEKF